MNQTNTKFFLLFIATLASLFFIGCGGNGTYSPKSTGTGVQPVLTGSYTLSVSPTSQQIYTFGEDDAVEAWATKRLSKPKEGEPDSTATFNVTVTPVNGYKGTVQLSATAATANAPQPSFSPASVSLDGTHPVTSILTVTDPAMQDRPGTYTYIVKGTDSSGNTVLPPTQPTVIAVQAVGAIQLQVQTDGSVFSGLDPGDSATWSVNVISENNFAGTVNLAITNPDNTKFIYTVSPSSVTLNSGQTKSVTVTVTNKAELQQEGGLTWTLSGVASNNSSISSLANLSETITD